MTGVQTCALPISRVQWLNIGDRNTTFFHRKGQGHMAKNRIVSLCTDLGESVDDYEKVKEIAMQYYQMLFSKVESFTLEKAED